MNELLLDDDLFDELITKDKINVEQELVKDVDGLRKSNSSTMYCAFSKNEICDESCKYFCTCSRRWNVSSLSQKRTALEKDLKKSLKHNCEQLDSNCNESINLVLKKYYKWLRKEGFVVSVVDEHIQILKKYHEYSFLDSISSPLLVLDVNELKIRFDDDVKYMQKLFADFGKTRVNATKRYYIDFMKSYVAETK